MRLDLDHRDNLWLARLVSLCPRVRRSRRCRTKQSRHATISPRR